MKNKPTKTFTDWRGYARFVGTARGNNDNRWQDDADPALFYVHNADTVVYTYRLLFAVSKRNVRRNLENAHQCRLTGRWPHYYESRKEI